MNGATPQLVHILKRLLSVDQIEFLTLEEMLDIQLTIPTIVAEFITNYFQAKAQGCTES